MFTRRAIALAFFVLSLCSWSSVCLGQEVAANLSPELRYNAWAELLVRRACSTRFPSLAAKFEVAYASSNLSKATSCSCAGAKCDTLLDNEDSRVLSQGLLSAEAEKAYQLCVDSERNYQNVDRKYSDELSRLPEIGRAHV